MVVTPPLVAPTIHVTIPRTCFLPAGANGKFSVKVIAANIAANAIPGATGTQQDFALVVENADPVSGAILNLANTVLSDAAPGGNGNGTIDPGENITLGTALVNNGDTSVSGVTATISTTSSYVTIVGGSTSYPAIAAGSTVTATTPFSFTVSPATPCGQVITLTVNIVSPSGNFSVPLTYQVGQTSVGAASVYTSTDVPKAIPDDNPTGITSTLPITASGKVGKVTVTINVSHTWDSDLTIKLISPSGTVVTLVAGRGTSGDNFTGTVFDDSAASPISSGSAPFANTYRPETPLSVVADQPISGTWQLFAVDSAAQDTGTINSWSLSISPRTYICQGALPASITATAGTPQTTLINTAFPSALQATVQTSGGAPVAGAVVTFTAPSTGASAKFSNNSNVITATTNASGVANSGTLTANGTTGSYTVAATVAGVATPANFSLTNSLTCNAYQVTATTDNGAATSCGTLSYAISTANSALVVAPTVPITITFALGVSNSVAVTGQLPTVKKGITINGGSCVSGPDITLNGTGTPGDGLTLQGGNLHSLRVANFGGRQIVSSGGSHLQCVVAAKSYP